MSFSTIYMCVLVTLIAVMSIKLCKGYGSMPSYLNSRHNAFSIHESEIALQGGSGLGKDVRLRRQRRYVAFPEGSSFTCAVCATVGVVGSPAFNYLSYGLNWGIAYDLPNETWIIDHLHGFGSKREPLAVLKRRQRRTLYRSIEDIVDRMGYNGRDCMLRALCESRQIFPSGKLGMVSELIRTIFSLPKTRLFTREIEENTGIEHYHSAYHSDENEDCEYKYPCSFSLIQLAMGGYSEPPPDYYGD